MICYNNVSPVRQFPNEPGGLASNAYAYDTSFRLLDRLLPRGCTTAYYTSVQQVDTGDSSGKQLRPIYFVSTSKKEFLLVGHALNELSQHSGCIASRPRFCDD